MEIIAKTKYISVSPEKLRTILRGLKKNMPAEKSLVYFEQMDPKGGAILARTIKQCIANAANNAKKSTADLTIKRIQIDEGPFLKRFNPVSRGTAHSMKRRTSHITVILEAPEVQTKKLKNEKTEKQEVNKEKKE
jgi:large subunit ribosomal protein L22